MTEFGIIYRLGGLLTSRVATLELMVCASKVRREEIIPSTFRLIFLTQQLHVLQCQSAETASSDAFVQSLPRSAQGLDRIYRIASHRMPDHLKPSDSIQQSLEETPRRMKKSSTRLHPTLKGVDAYPRSTEYHKKRTIRPRLGSRTMNIGKCVHLLKMKEMPRCPT